MRVLDPFFDEKFRGKPYDKSLDRIKWNECDLKAVKQIEVFKHLKYFLHLGVLTANTLTDKMREGELNDNDSSHVPDPTHDALEDEVNEIQDYLDDLKDKAKINTLKSIPLIVTPQ